MQLIVGSAGFVGLAVSNLFPDAEGYDVKSSYGGYPEGHYDFCHVAVPSPSNPDGSCNVLYVEEVISKIDADVFQIRSTIPPGTTDYLEKKYSKNLIMTPEYVASDAIYPQLLADIRNHPFIILGGRPEVTKKARRLYERVYPPTVRIFEVPAIVAEVIKYGENAFIATKLAFVNELYKICQQFGADYDQVREGVFSLDPRMTDWWTLTQGKGYKSKCLDKDIPAIIKASETAGYDPKFLKGVVEANERYKI